MKIFMFSADLYCGPCGEGIRSTIDVSNLEYPDKSEWHYNDSDTWPIEYDSGEGASDSPDHCGNHECGLFLELPLTEDGIRYVKETARTEQRLWANGPPVIGHTCQPSCNRSTERCAACISKSVNEIIQQWADFYQIKV